MSELSPCPACRRHVRGTTCPFCGAVTTRRSPIDLGAGRVSRAVVFASATLAASASCAHHAKPAADERGEERHAGGGGCSDPDQTQIDRLEAQKKEIEKMPDGPDKDQSMHDIDEQLRAARMPQCMPYGAPPARRRIV